MGIVINGMYAGKIGKIVGYRSGVTTMVLSNGKKICLLSEDIEPYVP